MTFVALSQVPMEDPEDEFLIDGLMSSSFGVLYGDPFAGKSMLTVSMAAALVNGDAEFLGRKVRQGFAGTVAFGLTDPRALTQTRRRINRLVPDLDRMVAAVTVDNGKDGYWERVAGELVDNRAGWFVLDNVLGAMPGDFDIGDPLTARRFLDRLAPIMQTGIPTLLVTHSPKSIRENGGGKRTPIGGTLFGARSRLNCQLAGKVAGTRTITVESNDSEPLTIDARCEMDGNTPRWTLAVKDTNPTRGEGTKDKRRQAALALVNAPAGAAASKSEAARYLAAKGYAAEETVRTTWLKPTGPLSALVVLVDGSWHWKPGAAGTR